LLYIRNAGWRESVSMRVSLSQAKEVPLMSRQADARDVPLGAKVFARDGFELGTVHEVRGRFFEVIGEERCWLPLAIVHPTEPGPAEPGQGAPSEVFLSVGKNGLGDYQLLESRAA
jgi:hypothetical protein